MIAKNRQRGDYGIIKYIVVLESLMKQTKITKIQAREILDSRGNPTVETTVWAGDLAATASVPSGASTGTYEAVELRDNDPKRYDGLGVLKACHNVNEVIAPALHNVGALDQETIDRKMIDLDGVPNKSVLGANAILSVSLASARLAAMLEDKELFEYLADHYGYKVKNLPVPLLNVINGGLHADSGLDIQEYQLIPQGGPFSEQLRRGTEVDHALKKNLAQEHYGTAVGDEGGFAPHLKSNEAGLQELVRAIETAGYKPGQDFKLGLDPAASEFYDAKTEIYHLKLDDKKYKPQEMYQLYQDWAQKYPLELVEDGCGEDDFVGWKLLTDHLGEQLVLVGDDLFTTNVARMQQGIAAGLANAVLIKLNQIGTLTETLQAIKLAQQNNYKVVISHRSGETEDNFIADLAAAVNADYIKAGAPNQGERLAKYNRLLAIEQKLSAA